jgi:precorrin-2 dehydrogenase/sirohydrochlorin ferrochelatase/precorrin-6A/cobalt-precorrin-6A reductase
MKILIFGGTTEGRKLAGLLSSDKTHDVTLSVATDYGKDIISQNAKFKILSKRQNQSEMTILLNENNFDYTIDATHPYASEATKNIKAACDETKTKYLRLIRHESPGDKSAIYVDTAAKAANFLQNTSGNILLTVGSKELEAFTAIENYSSRLYVRIIPMADSLQKAINLGFKSANIICMQGPFETDMNVAMLKMTDAAYMVTKDSGETGGFEKKLTAAKQTGCQVVVITRPCAETGYTLEEIMKIFKIKDNTYFPLFINMHGKKAVIVGGGKVAERRIKMLLDYGANITVISPDISEELRQIAQNGEIRHIERKYTSEDISGAFLVIAATNDRAVNHKAMEDSKTSSALAIVADSREECSCYFPAIAENGEYIAGIVSKNGNHAGVKNLAQKLREYLNNE